MFGRSRLIGIVPAAFMAATLGAQHESDIILRHDGQRIVTGAVVGGQIVYGERVFVAHFGEEGIEDVTFEPGFDSEVGGLPANTVIGLAITRALRAWDGSRFERIPEERIAIEKNGMAETPLRDPGLCESRPTVELGRTSSLGHLHQHATFTLRPPAGPGVYLLEVAVWAGQPGSGESLPVWIAFGQGADEDEVVRAGEWVRDVMGCDADFNRDGRVDIRDFFAFQAAYSAGDARADCTGDCRLDIRDFFCFQAAYARGCG